MVVFGEEVALAGAGAHSGIKSTNQPQSVNNLNLDYNQKLKMKLVIIIIALIATVGADSLGYNRQLHRGLNHLRKRLQAVDNHPLAETKQDILQALWNGSDLEKMKKYLQIMHTTHSNKRNGKRMRFYRSTMRS